MKYLMGSSSAYRQMMLLAIMLVASVFMVNAAIPESQNPPRLVNDFAEIFTPQQRAELEDSLVAFSKNTSNQITIVTVNSLDGQDKAQYAYEIGEKWGVGGKKLNNGIVMLIKPKNETNGEVFIATGYGLEGALPDAACMTIIDREMIPNFKQNNYYQGVVDALKVIKPIAAKEYTFEQYEEDSDDSLWIVIIVIIIIFVIVFSFGKGDDGNNSGTYGGRRNGGGGVFIGGFGGGFGGGSSGGSSGFGGFGGGGFGGGGAGGSW